MEVSQSNIMLSKIVNNFVSLLTTFFYAVTNTVIHTLLKNTSYTF